MLILFFNKAKKLDIYVYPIRLSIRPRIELLGLLSPFGVVYSVMLNFWQVYAHPALCKACPSHVIGSQLHVHCHWGHGVDSLSVY